MAVAVCGMMSGAQAQQPPPRTVGIYTIGQQVPISDPTYAFAGVYFLSNGGANALAVTTADGVVLVDAKLRGWGPVVLEALQQVTDDPVVRIIKPTQTRITQAPMASTPARSKSSCTRTPPVGW